MSSASSEEEMTCAEPSGAASSDTEAARYGILFGVRKSVRYHDRRVGHYERLHRVTSLISILLAGYVFLEISGLDLPCWAIWLAAFGAILSACDMVQGYSKCADLHRNLKRRFLELEIKMQAASFPLSDAIASRLTIEGDEPPVFRALDLLCHNELCAAEGQNAEHFAKTSIVQRWSANWIKWTNITATKPASGPRGLDGPDDQTR